MASCKRVLGIVPKLTTDMVLQTLNPFKNTLLTLSETALPPSQAKAFRKLFLRELGRDGFEKALRELEEGANDNGANQGSRNGQRHNG